MPVRSASSTTPVASIGVCGRPSARANTFVDPAGTTPSAGTLSCTPSVSRPLTTSLTVPSPPKATTTSVPLRMARQASAAAWPRLAVSSTSSSASLPRAWVSTSRSRAVVAVARGFETTRTRTRSNNTDRLPLAGWTSRAWWRVPAPAAGRGCDHRARGAGAGRRCGRPGREDGHRRPERRVARAARCRAGPVPARSRWSPAHGRCCCCARPPARRSSCCNCWRCRCPTACGSRPDVAAYGAPIMLAALAVLFLLFTPPAREALDRDLSR